MPMVTTDYRPGKIVGQKVAGLFCGLHQDVPAVCIFGPEVSDVGYVGLYNPAPFSRIQNGKTPRAAEVPVDLPEESFHTDQKISVAANRT